MCKDQSADKFSNPSLMDHSYAKNANPEVPEDLALKSGQSPSSKNQNTKTR